jgi:hypothetical protein
MLYNNIKSVQLMESIEDGLVPKPENITATKPSTVQNQQSINLLLPESFESSIQGLQFIQKTTPQ